MPLIILLLMSNQKKIFLGLLILVTFLVIYLIKDFFGVISLTILVSLMFNPIYKRLLGMSKGNKGLATSLTLFTVFLSLIIPIGLIGVLTTYQIREVAVDLKEANLSSSDIGRISNDILNQSNNILKNYNIQPITIDQINSSLTQSLRSGGGYLLDAGGSFGARLPEYITMAILFIVLLTFILPYQEKILLVIKKISPLSDEITKIYLNRISAMARSMINGTFIVALVQAIIGGITLWFVGAPYPLFFTFVLMIASIIPLLGSGLIMIPAGIILIATGNIIGGIVVLAIQFILISNIDNVLRPKLVEEDARLPEAITLLGIIAGLSVFGILGLIFGPVIMVIAYTTYEIYLKFYAISVKNYLNS